MTGSPDTPGASRATGASGSTTSRAILALALPALGALIAEPLFILVDTAVIGHLGTAPLAGLALASSVLLTVVGLCVFLAYATTSVVARRMGAGRPHDALRGGVDGLWLALLLGVGLATALWASAPVLVALLGADSDVAVQAVAYLRWSAPGLPGMLLVLAGTGVLRGLRDTRTPLAVAVCGAALNTLLDIVLVYGAGMGIAGSGLGTSVTQLLMGAWLVAVVTRAARERDVPLRPARSGILASARAGVPLLIRTATLRAALLLTVVVATSLGGTGLAAHQIVTSVWGLTAFALDALAIAAQALIGHGVGAGARAEVRRVLRICLRWGIVAGTVLGAATAAGGWWLAAAFTSDPDVRATTAVALVVAGALMPLAGWVFVLDGVLIGAGDGVYLARSGLLVLVAYLPPALAVLALAPTGTAGLAWLWAAFGVFMAGRAVVTGLRARGDAWLAHAA